MRPATLYILHTLATLSSLHTLVTAAPITSKQATQPLLLVLRTACNSNDGHIFEERTLQSYANSIQKAELLSGQFKILSYNETCGSHWRESVASAVLQNMVSGGTTESVGWPGSLACTAMRLPLPQGDSHRSPALRACTGPQAHAAALAFLLARLRWRHIHLPPHPLLTANDTDICNAVLDAAQTALLAAGLVVRRNSLHHEDNKDPFTSILCADEKNDIDTSNNEQNNIALLIQTPSSRSTTAQVTRDPPLHNRLFEIVNVKPDLDLNEETFPSPTNYVRYTNNNKHNKSQQLGNPAAGDKLSENGTKHRETNMTTNIFLFNRDPMRYLHSFVLMDAQVDVKNTYDTLLDLLEIGNNNTVGIQHKFHLYESKMVDGTARWVAVTMFLTNSSQAEDHSWHTDVVWESDEDFDVWCNDHAASTEDRYLEQGVLGRPGETVCVVGAVIVGLAAIVLSIYATRRTLAKRMQRRPRAAVLLSPADFEFPADEQRRVGEGMESMLSWLQQLHELPSGPNHSERDQPDLLKRPTAPSAPSSTCSVTRLPPDGQIRYKGDPVQMNYFSVASLELKRKSIDVLLVMQSLRHENINPFIGCLCTFRPALVFAAAGRGTLEAALVADEIKLDWAFRLSLLTDLVRGMRYLHASPLRVHGRLSSRTCLVDARWVLRISDYGQPHLARAQALTTTPCGPVAARDLLWTAPELLREGDSAYGTQPGDVFSFSIIMQEVIVRGEPYCMLSLTPEELVEKLCRPPPLIRPSVSMGAAPPEAVSVMRQCWSEQPDLRPDFNRLYDIFRHLHRGRKVNIMDSMFEMLEKYSNNLEELIKERTEQLDIEKKKTEQLLNRMLPRSVADRLVLGLRVEPEIFEEVSIYFSDIVGFTALAARSTPVQVVDLLNDLYTTFDAAIEQYSVYKVETIGDAYMVVGGLPLRNTEHAQAVATMALHLLHLAGRFRIRHAPGTPLHLRIGLHTGPCCAGVVGLTMPRYCLFGDTVNTASRMESTGAAWRVHLSSATAERLAAAGGYRLRSRGLTQVKGKGAMHTYWLLGKEGFDKPLPTPPPLESEEVLFETECENDSESSDQSVRAAPSGAHAVERQSSDPCAPSSGNYGLEQSKSWSRSGTASAESSPATRPPRYGAPRYRYLSASLEGGGVGPTRGLRRQWSLERGEALAAAAADVPAAPIEVEPLEPLALRAPPPRPTHPRYRTRPDSSHLSNLLLADTERS
ncbi:unnamed protein product [Leptosia nina]|uniref:Guanylate cyclase n=1 Tax=Leptosia nina TaxID=320188 RepID=A0AAV1IYJ9_9NEOP